MSATQDEVNKQRAALLTAVAQQGTAGKTAYEAEAARQAEAAKAAAAAVAGSASGTGMKVPPALLAQIAAQNAAQQSVYAQDNKMASTNYTNSLNQTSMSNAAYMDQARAAVPVVEAQTAGQIAQIRAQQEEARLQREEAAKERAYNERMRALGLQEKAQAEQGDAAAFLQGAQKDARDTYLDRIKASGNKHVYAAVKNIVGGARDFGEAMAFANRYINAEIAAGTLKPDERKRGLLDVQRAIYGYYVGSEPSSDAQSFGYQVRKYGGNPEYVPGFRTASERAAARRPTESSTLYGRDPALR